MHEGKAYEGLPVIVSADIGKTKPRTINCGTIFFILSCLKIFYDRTHGVLDLMFKTKHYCPSIIGISS